MAFNGTGDTFDPALEEAIEAEASRQQNELLMIASENYTSADVNRVVGSVLTNKYAEGYPGRRYYGGCEHVDIVEKLAIERACALFGAEDANVQPHSGSLAILAAYLATLQPGDSVLGLDLAQGGHLTHGMRLNISGMLFNFFSYGVTRDDQRIDFDQIAKLARSHKPKVIVAGASAYPREIQHDRFAEIANDAGAVLIVDMAHYAGLVAGGVHQNPVPHADIVVSSSHKTLRGPRSGFILCRQEYLKDINRAIFPGTQGGPMMHVIAGKAAAFREAMQPSFSEYARRLVDNARALGETLIEGGIPLTTGGTDTHLVLANVTSLGLGGRKAEAVLGECGITVNMNMLPFDERKPMDPSGIRIGTPAATTRGMGVGEMRDIGRLIVLALQNPDDQTTIGRIRAQVGELCGQFPIPSNFGVASAHHSSFD